MGKNILEVCLSPDLGGLELFTVQCYNSFKQKGICKVALAPEKKLDIYLECEDKFYLKRNKLFPFVPAMKLAKYIDANNIDIIHFHWTKDMITVVLAKLLSSKKPQLIQSRHMGMTRFKDDIYHRWIYKNIDKIHAVTNQVKEQLEIFIPSAVRPKIEMIYLGTKVSKINEAIVVSLKQKYNLTDEFVVGIIGRIEEEKGQYKVIEAVAKLRDLNIKIFIVGPVMSESYLQKLQQKVKQFDIEDKVIFTGFTKNISEYFQLFDVNILATTNETFGLVVIEAMANKIPMIATNRGGPLEIIEDGVDGLLFDGSSENLAQKIKILYQDKNLQKRLSQAGFEKVMEKFHADIQLNILYGSLM